MRQASKHPRATIALILSLVSCLVFAAGAQGPTSPLRFPEKVLAGEARGVGDEVLPGELEDEAFWGEEVWLEPQRVAAGFGKLVLEVRLPEGYKANYLAPFSIAWWSEGARVVVHPEHASHSIERPDFPLRLEFPAFFFEGEAVLTGDLTIYYCREGADALCLIKRARLRLPVTGEKEGASALGVTYHVADVEPW